MLGVSETWQIQLLGRGGAPNQSVSKATDTADVVCEWYSIALHCGAGHMLGLVQPWNFLEVPILAYFVHDESDTLQWVLHSFIVTVRVVNRCSREFGASASPVKDASPMYGATRHRIRRKISEEIPSAPMCDILGDQRISHHSSA